MRLGKGIGGSSWRVPRNGLAILKTVAPFGYLATALLVASCGSPAKPPGNPVVPIYPLRLNPAREWMFYWGNEPYIDVPNTGRPAARYMGACTWPDSEHLVVLTAHTTSNQSVVGACSISLDAQAQFARVDDLPNTRALQTVLSARSGALLVGLARIGFGQAIYSYLPDLPMEDPLVEVPGTWLPRCVAVAGDDTLLFLGTRPSDGVRGLYAKGSRTPSLPDLVMPTASSPAPASAAAVANRMFLFTEDEALIRLTRLLAISLASPGSANVLVERQGQTAFLSANPRHPSIVAWGINVAGDETNPPGSQIVLVDVARGVLAVVENRLILHDGVFTTLHSGAWSPGGASLAVVASAFSGEGGVLPPTLWLHRNIGSLIPTPEGLLPCETDGSP